MSNLRIEHTIEDGVTVWRMDGRLDGQGAAVLEAFMQQQLGAGDLRLVLDLGGVDYISSAGLRCILIVAKKVQALRGWLGLCGLTPMVLNVMSLSGFQQLLKIYETRAEALSAATSRA